MERRAGPEFIAHWIAAGGPGSSAEAAYGLCAVTHDIRARRQASDPGGASEQGGPGLSSSECA
eukprot:332754-Hanusia_phi.AAC.1